VIARARGAQRRGLAASIAALVLAQSVTGLAEAADPGALGTKVGKTQKVAAPNLTAEQRMLAGALLGLEPRTIELELVQKLVPKTWRLEVSGLPTGVVAVASGPDAEGRAAVLVSRTSDVLEAELLARRGARDVLASRLGAGVPGLVVTSTRARGLLGGVEVSTEARRDGAEDLALLHLFTASPAGYFVTIAAAPARVEALRARIQAFVAEQPQSDALRPAPAQR
jgi:hypothetical protein